MRRKMKKQITKAIICVMMGLVLIAVGVLLVFMFYFIKTVNVEKVATKITQYAKDIMFILKK